MAYQYPLNGGRINASVSGNSTSAGAGYQLVSTGTLVLAGGNNVTLNQNANSISISGLNYANSNGVTFGINAGTLTASVNAAQSVQTIGGYASGNTTGQSSSTTFDARSMSISAMGGASAGFSGGMLQVSAPAMSSLSQTGIISLSQNGNTISIGAPAFSAGMSNIGNTSGSAGTISNQIIFAGGNNITLSQSTGAGGNTITISGANIPAQTVQTQSRFNMTLTGNTAGVMAQVSSGVLSLAGGNNIVLSQAGNAITISGSAQTAQTQSNIQGIIASGSTNQTGNISFANGGGVTFGLSNNTITASVAPGGGGGIALANSQTIYTSGTASLLEGAGAITIGSAAGQALNISVPQASSISATGAISISTSGNTISIGAPNQTNQTLGMYGVSNTTQSTFGTADARSLSFHGAGGVSVGISNGSVVVSGGAGGGGGGGVALSGAGGSITSGTASVVGGGALSASFNGQTLNLNAPATSMLSAGDGISISTTGSTVVFQAAPSTGGTSSAPLTLSRWEYPINIFTAIGAPVINSMSLQRVLVPFNVSGQSMRVGAAFTVSNITSLTTANVNISLQLGIYTLSGSTLSRVSSGSTLNSFSWSASSQSSQFNSLRQLTAPINVNMVPGEYWVGAILSSASTYAGATMSMYGNDRIVGTGAMGNFGSHISSSARDVILGQGLFATASLPASVAISAIVNTGTQAMRAGIYHAIYNATY